MTGLLTYRNGEIIGLCCFELLRLWHFVYTAELVYSSYYSGKLLHVFSAVSLSTSREMKPEMHKANKDGCINESTDAVWLEAQEVCPSREDSESPTFLPKLPAAVLTG